MTPRRRATDPRHLDGTSMRRPSIKTVVGYVVSGIAVIGGLWAFATIAADHVMAPHVSAAKARVHIMCSQTDRTNRMLMRICKATGETCDDLDMTDLVATCRETDQ